MNVKITKSLIMLAAALLVAAAFVLPAAAADTLSIELPGGDFDSGVYKAEVYLTGTNVTEGCIIKSLTTTIASDNADVKISNIAVPDLKFTITACNPENVFGQNNPNQSAKITLSGGKTPVKLNDEGKVLVATFDVVITDDAFEAGDEVELTLVTEKLTIGDTKVDAGGIAAADKTLSADTLHTIEVGSINANVEDKKVKSDLAAVITAKSELGVDIESFDYAIASANNSVEIILDDDDNFKAFFALKANEAVPAVLSYEIAGDKVVEKDITIDVAKKSNLAAAASDAVFSYTQTSYLFNGNSIKQTVINEIAAGILNHNAGDADKTAGFERAIAAGDLTLALKKNGETVDDAVDGGSYTFDIIVADNDNYVWTTDAARKFTNATNFKFNIVSEILPTYTNGTFNAVTPATLVATYNYAGDDYATILKANVTVPKFYTLGVTSAGTPIDATGAALQLPFTLASAAASYGADELDTTGSNLKFLKNQTFQAQTETFTFTSAYCKGDVDQSGEVDADDATFICEKLVAENPNWTEAQVFYGRLAGGSYTPTVLDALNIAKYSVDLLDENYQPIAP